MSNTSRIYKVVGIGFGPANISLAAYYAEEAPNEDVLFLERMDAPNWQPEMLFENAMDIHSNVQNIPHRDLATPRNPRSRFTFLNYLFEQGLLLDHLNMDLLMPMRPDYAGYVRWVAQELSHKVEYGRAITGLSLVENGADRPLYKIDCGGRDPVLAVNVVVGTGRTPYVPSQFENLVGSPRVSHLNHYKSFINKLVVAGARKVAVIGSSQSAIEIMLHLQKFEPRIETHSIFRRFAYPLKDTNPFMSEIFFPEFTGMYYHADAALKRRIDRDVSRTNYGACDLDVLEELYRQRYYEKIQGKDFVRINRLTEIISAKESVEGILLSLLNHETGESRDEWFDGVILATGFRNIGVDERSERVPAILSGLTGSLALDADGCVQVSRDYRAKLLDAAGPAGGLFLNGLCEASHGMGDAGSLSLLSKRAEVIAKAMDQHDHGSAIAAE